MKMKGMGRAVMVFVGMGLLVLVVGARPPEPTPVTLTHLGVKPSDMVTLRGQKDPDPPKFVRVYSDGSVMDFSLPEGKVLVITDVGLSGSTNSLKVNGEVVWRYGNLGGNNFTAGFVVSAPGLLQADPLQSAEYVILRGYLTDDQ